VRAPKKAIRLGAQRSRGKTRLIEQLKAAEEDIKAKEDAKKPEALPTEYQQGRQLELVHRRASAATRGVARERLDRLRGASVVRSQPYKAVDEYQAIVDGENAVVRHGPEEPRQGLGCYRES